MENFLDFITSQCIMKTITQEDDQWEAFTLLVWTLGWFWSKNTGQFVQHPVGWGIETLQMFLLTTGHFYFVVWLRSKQNKLKFFFRKNIEFSWKFQKWQKFIRGKFSLKQFDLCWMNQFSKIFLFLSHWKSVVTRDKREVVIGGWSIRKRVLQCEKMNKTLRKREKNNPNLNSPKIDDESLIEEPR